MKKLFLSPSLYSLFLYTLLDKDWKYSDYVLSYRIPKAIHENLKKIGVEVYSTPLFEGNPIKKIIGENIGYLKYLIFSSHKRYDKVFGNDEFHYSYKYREQGIELIEDGSFNSESKDFFKRRIIKQDLFLINYWFYWIWRKYIPYGYDNKVKNIWKTEKIQLPLEISKKGKQINIKELWNSKSMKEQSEILTLFGMDISFVKNISYYNHVLVTQNLPIPDKDKIEIYKSMIKGIDENMLLIKTHYAEKTNYFKYFPKAKIISSPIPFQLFELLNYTPKNIYTISSSAILPFIKENTNIYFLGTEIDERIKKEYGIIRFNDIIKT